MKSLVCNVFGMAMGVACLALILNRPSVADEEQAAQEQKHVIVVQADGDQTAHELKHVIVVKADEQTSYVADTVKKALHEKLDSLPADIQEKIKQKLKAVKALRDSKHAVSARVLELKSGDDGKHIVIQIEPKDGVNEASQTGQVIQLKTIVVGSDDDAGAVEQSAAQQQQQTATVVAKAIGDGEEKHMAVAVAVDGQDVAGDVKEKTITVTVKDGQVVIDGKPVKIPALKAVKEGKTLQIQARPAAKAHSEVVKRLKGIESELKQIRKLLEEMQQDDADN